jgi:UDP-N-acetylmuramate dehydrogenase
VTWLNGLEHIVRKEEPLAPYTWFRLGGAAEYFAEPTSHDELSRLVERCRDEQVSVRLLGGGSDILVADDGVRGMVIHLAAPAFCGISVEGTVIDAGGGAKLSHVVATAAREGLAGLEALVGIPGTIGGALRCNCSGHGASIGEWTREAGVMTRSGHILRRQRQEMRFSYRTSSLDELVILGARFQLEPQDPIELTRRMQKLWIVKRSSEPTREHGCGHIFADPRGVGAAELIEQAGLKGLRVGAAEVSERNANFIVARPGATAADVQQLIDLVRARVAEQLGVDLQREIKIWS